MKRLMQRLWREEHGATATEYGIIAAIIAVGIIAVLFTFRDSLRNMFRTATENVNRGYN